MAGRYPPARLRLIPAGPSDPPIIPIGVILHVAVSEAASLHDYFAGRSGGVESHAYITRSGVFEQYREFTREADANYRANSFVRDGRRYGFLSVETQGLERGRWDPPQLDAIKAFLLWAAREFGFPLAPCPGPYAPGVGYHTMFGAPGPWTPVAKTCPGPDRIRQFHEVLVPWMAGGAEEDDMPAPKDWTKADWAAFDTHVFAAVWRRDELRNLDAKGQPVKANPTWQAASFLEWGRVRDAQILARVAALEAVAVQLAQKAGITADDIRRIIAEEVVRVQVTIDAEPTGADNR